MVSNYNEEDYFSDNFTNVDLKIGENILDLVCLSPILKKSMPKKKIALKDPT